MGSRDHSIECEACGEMREGMNDARCLCDRVQMSDEEHAARYGVICATCDARGETPGTCECAPHVGTGVYRAGRSVRVEWTRTLAANLAVAGALCEAFDAGYVEGSDWAEGWRPGCGRAWGGGE